jgi:hypothetical protein
MFEDGNSSPRDEHVIEKKPLIDLSVIIVCTNEYHFLRTCLPSLFASAQGLELEVIVVDNASSDGTQEMLQREFPTVRVLRNAENLGFAAANNRGLAIASGELLMLLNPDTEVQGKAVYDFVRFVKANPEVGIAGCRLVLPDGSTQQSVRSFPSVWNVFCEISFLYRVFPKSKLFGRYYMSYFDYESSLNVDWVCGACIVFRRAVYETVGALDEQFFMYTEEMDYCFRAHKSGYQTWYFPGASIKHFWGGYNAFTRRIILWTNGSQMLFFQKHFKGITRTLLQSMKIMGLVNRFFLFLILGLLKRNTHDLRKSYFHLYAAWKLMTEPWQYHPGRTSPAAPWPQ